MLTFVSLCKNHTSFLFNVNDKLSNVPDNETFIFNLNKRKIVLRTGHFSSIPLTGFFQALT